MKALRWLTLAALLLPAARPAAASSTTSAVTGVVKDAAGTPVPDAEIELVLEGFGTRHTLKSDARGKFTQVALKPGAWKVTARKEGFVEATGQVQLRLAERTPIELIINPTAAAGKTAAGEPTVEFMLSGIKLSKEAAEAYQSAQDALARGDGPAARPFLEKVTAIEPTIPQPYFVLGQIEREAGDKEKALAHLRKGLELKPDEATAWIALGEVETDRGALAEALAAFQKAAELAPEDARGFKKLGMAYIMMANYAGAETALSQYLSMAPDAADAAEKKALLEEVRKLARTTKK